MIEGPKPVSHSKCLYGIYARKSEFITGFVIAILAIFGVWLLMHHFDISLFGLGKVYTLGAIGVTLFIVGFGLVCIVKKVRHKGKKDSFDGPVPCDRDVGQSDRDVSKKVVPISVAIAPSPERVVEARKPDRVEESPAPRYEDLAKLLRDFNRYIGLSCIYAGRLEESYKAKATTEEQEILLKHQYKHYSREVKGNVDLAVRHLELLGEGLQQILGQVDDEKVCSSLQFVSEVLKLTDTAMKVAQDRLEVIMLYWDILGQVYVAINSLITSDSLSIELCIDHINRCISRLPGTDTKLQPYVSELRQAFDSMYSVVKKLFFIRDKEVRSQAIRKLEELKIAVYRLGEKVEEQDYLSEVVERVEEAHALVFNKLYIEHLERILLNREKTREVVHN